MKILLLFFTLLLTIGQAHAQIANIPDPVFKQALLDHGFYTGVEIDTNFDGEIQVSEAEAITSFLDVNGQFIDITDLTGIEAFINITELEVWGNQLTSLDLSQNTLLQSLGCWGNQLTNLNVSQCSALEVIWGDYNQLTSLDLSNNINLTHIYLYDNLLASLDLTQNSLLQVVSLTINQLAFLDVRSGNNIALTNFSSEYNPDLICIFVDDSVYSEENWFRDPNSTFVETQAQCDTLGIDEVILSKNLQLYPNPITDQLFINGTNTLNIQSLQLYDVLGKQVLQELHNFEKIDVSSLKSGVYLVKIETDKGVITKKVVKE